MKQERIQNPSFVDRAVIESKIAEGFHVILQFDKPAYYSPELLKKINNLCGEFGEKLEVRFYGHYGTFFDASALSNLTEIESLSIDCLSDVSNLAALGDLKNLHCLSLGICNLDDPHILQSLQLQKLESLSLGESLKANFDLAPLQSCFNLKKLFVVKHTKNIDLLPGLPVLQSLRLVSIPKKQRLDFVSKIKTLKRLVLILGGRANISEIYHPNIEELEILRVMGFDDIDSINAFPSLCSLVIEDQIRLKRIRFTPTNNKIQSLRIFNCKTLQSLNGLEGLTELKSISVGMTALSVDSLLEQYLPRSLRTFAFYTGKAKENEIIRKKLDAFGYTESAVGTPSL